MLLDVYVSYGQIMVFDASVKLPGCLWTPEHGRQGFVRRDQTASFRTIVEYGHTPVHVHLEPFVSSPEHVCAIEVPLRVTSGAVAIGGPEEIERKNLVALPAGSYRVTCAQSGTESEGETVEIYLEKLERPLTHSRILVAGDFFDPPGPPSPLVEDAEIA